MDRHRNRQTDLKQCVPNKVIKNKKCIFLLHKTAKISDQIKKIACVPDDIWLAFWPLTIVVWVHFWALAHEILFMVIRLVFFLGMLVCLAL